MRKIDDEQLVDLTKSTAYIQIDDRTRSKEHNGMSQ